MTPLQWVVVVLVGVGWLYEVVALTLRWWPTITALVKPYNDSGLVQLAVIAVVGGTAFWAIAHLLAE